MNSDSAIEHTEDNGQAEMRYCNRVTGSNNAAIESLEATMQQMNIANFSWNHILFSSLMGRLQELAADILHGRYIPYKGFKRRQLSVAGYTYNAAGIQLWETMYQSYSDLTPAQWMNRRKRLALSIMEISTSLPVAAEKIAMASIYTKLGKKGRAYLDGRVTE